MRIRTVGIVTAIIALLYLISTGMPLAEQLRQKGKPPLPPTSTHSVAAPAPATQPPVAPAVDKAAAPAPVAAVDPAPKAAAPAASTPSAPAKIEVRTPSPTPGLHTFGDYLLGPRINAMYVFALSWVLGVILYLLLRAKVINFDVMTDEARLNYEARLKDSLELSAAIDEVHGEVVMLEDTVMALVGACKREFPNWEMDKQLGAAHLPAYYVAPGAPMGAGLPVPAPQEARGMLALTADAFRRQLADQVAKLRGSPSTA